MIRLLELDHDLNYSKPFLVLSKKQTSPQHASSPVLYPNHLVGHIYRAKSRIHHTSPPYFTRNKFLDGFDASFRPVTRKKIKQGSTGLLVFLAYNSRQADIINKQRNIQTYGAQLRARRGSDSTVARRLAVRQARSSNIG